MSIINGGTKDKMTILPDYKISEVIHENNVIKIYRGYTVKDQVPVIIKALKKEAARPLEISMLMHEYEITRNLDIEGIIKPMKFEQAGSLFALVMKDIGAVSLREYIRDYPADLHCFLNIAVQLTEAIGQLHQNRIIHRDLKPENILIHTDTGKCYVTGFSSAVIFQEDSKNVLLSNNPVGTPEYMSPEQTGRLNIGVDYRTDFYSLGVVFYEIITGRLPLQVENSIEWAYAHLTRKPIPPEEINPSIPSGVSGIILKLLNKDPEERYQSAHGLLWDLKECKRQLNETGKIKSVSIGKMDNSTRLRLFDKFYGRRKEIRTLRAAFRRVCEGKAEIILISGEPGIGKTMLVNESFKPGVLEKGYFIMGKVDQLRKNIPYAPYADAFRNLVRQLMTENSKKLGWWKNKILHSIGKSCAVITEIIPELEWIIGKQPSVETLPPQEAENRFLNVFRDFIKVFVWEGHPMILFLDDLQWADLASVKLLKYLIQDINLSHLLILAAFRENELEEDHPLNEILKAPREQQGQNNMIQISLSPLNRIEVEKLVADTLGTELKKSKPLAQCMYRKSAGNPFSLRQLLMLIHDEGLLYFNMQEGRWQWDLKAIESLRQGADILELILRKIQKLPKETRELLMLASCYGNKFDLETLSFLWNRPMGKTAASLMPSVREGLIIMHEKEDAISSSARPVKKDTVYEFLHDRVQQAAYSLFTEEEKKKKHIMIGSYLLENTPAINLEENILSIMDHFNRGLELIHDPEKRIQLARYNFMAGRKARASAAYASALQYFICGNLLMPDKAWEHDYRLSFDLHLELAQAQYLCADAEAAETLFNEILERSKTELERADVYGSKMILYAGIGRLAEAVNTGMQALSDLGVKIPLHPTALDFAKELFLYRWYMLNKNIEDLLQLPEMEDVRQKKISELLARLCYVTMSTSPRLYSFIVVKTGNFALRYGNSESSPVGYLGYGITAGSIFGNYKAGESYSRVSIQLAEKYDRSSSKCIIYFVTGSLISHWTKHASFGLDYLRKAIITGTEAGNLLIVDYSHCLLLENQYIMGIPLEKINEEIREKYEVVRKIKHHHLRINTVIYDTVVSALIGRKADSPTLGVTELEKNELLHLAQEDKTSLATYYCCGMQLYYLTGDYREALSMSQKVRPLVGTIFGFMLYAEYFFYDSLTITSIYNELSRKERKIYVRILRKNLRKLKKWAQSCKENFEHKYLLICAQIASLKNKIEKAMLLYDKAIRSAHDYNYMQNEALANELAAKFYLEQGAEKAAKTYMIDAFNGYKNWGAVLKVNELLGKYPNLLREMDKTWEGKTQDLDKFKHMLHIPMPNARQMAGNNDSYFINKEIESISGETDINKLLEGFLGIIVRSTGADTGHLIFEKNGELFIEATKDACSSKVEAKTIPLEEYDEIAKSVVNYVAQTSDTTVINLGDKAGIFANDPYITSFNPKSIACLPLSFQGINFGVLYLENRFLPGIFTSQCLDTVKLLSIHIACAKKLQDYISEDSIESKEVEYIGLIEPLTERETEVLKLVAKGMSNKEIADWLEITINTVKGHVKNIYTKLGVNRRLQAVTKAKALKILKDN